MVVMTPVTGLSGDLSHPFSRTGAYLPNRAMISALRADTRDRISVQRLRGAGLGALDVPAWTWWAAGGLAAGAIAGFLLFKKK